LDISNNRISKGAHLVFTKGIRRDSHEKIPQQWDFFVGNDGTIKVMLKLTTVFFLITLTVLATLHWIAMTFYLYWRWEWVDIFMHFFGGAVTALGLFTVRDFMRRIPERFEYVVPILSGVIIITLLWELFEFFVVGIPLAMPYIAFDTALDIVMGVAGGFVGFLVGHSLRHL